LAQDRLCETVSDHVFRQTAASQSSALHFGCSSKTGFRIGNVVRAKIGATVRGDRRVARLAALCSLVLLSACMRGGEPVASAQSTATPEVVAVPVVVAPVEVRRTERVINFVGTLFGEEEVTLSALIEGQIKTLTVDMGDPIEAGQVVAEIHDDRLRAQLREVEAGWAKARADELRGSQLVGKQVISPQEFESMQTAVRVAEAQRDTIKVMIDNAVVRAPLAGSVAKRLVSVGEFVRPGSPLFQLVADDRLKLRGDVPERFAQELAVGQLVEIAVDAHPDTTFAGRLARISPTANRENRSVSVEAIVQNHDRRLKPGFFANARVVTKIDDEALMVPETAVVKFAGVTKVFVVRDNIAYQHEVRTGTRGSQGLIEIAEGVTPSDHVVTAGMTKLEDGMPVTIKPTDG
jgi:membrane fusion protein (multidrug efflux system)